MILPFQTRKSILFTVVAALSLTAATAGAAASRGHLWDGEREHDFTVGADSFRTSGTAVSGSLLSNDRGATAVVRHGEPAHGSLALDANGAFTYTPQPGFKGTDTFTYSATDAVQLFASDLPPVASLPGYDPARDNGPVTVRISGGAYGSALTPTPDRSGNFYGLTDRGPNADHPDGHKTEPMSYSFVPSIGRFRLKDGKQQLIDRITLKGPRSLGGVNYSGRPPHDTAEQIYNLDQSVEQFVRKDPYGYDPEGLVALPDGTFWVSDEYGPYLTHFDRDGYEMGRLTPHRTSPDNAFHTVLGHLPEELGNRTVNKGMEGLTVTPDGRTLVGVMQAALQQPDLAAGAAAKVAVDRIVTVDLRTYETKQYAYLLTDPATTKSAVSEITALSATRFIVDERDGNPGPFAFKQLFDVDVNGATDLSGLSVDGKSVEAFVGPAGTNAALQALTGKGIQVANKQVYLDLGALVSQLNPTGGFFGADKVEGVATPDGGRTLYISNDSDFGINSVNVSHEDAAHRGWTVNQKTVNGAADDGSVLKVDTARLPAVVKTATVTVRVR
ncbi:esterase-like activity of phytase family protein (plasmid) [Kitasatospora sp. NBC_00070]|uniref:esterase-like activity of phytase family protein n=1 Tax=Kitasatospora sp. NBC_00070 TaxID=2975962 RepID=UPI002F912706